MDKYGKFEVIGTGSFGTVNKATEKCSQRDVALKMIMKVRVVIICHDQFQCNKFLLSLYRTDTEKMN